jgi:Zn-dependent protease with chaperone function
MPDTALEPKFTPAARQALDELVQEYKNQIILAAARAAASPSGEITEISVRDILSAVDATQLRRPTSPMRRRTEYLLRLYAIAGVITGVLSLCFLFYENFSYYLDPLARLMVLVAAFGFGIAIVSYVMLRFQVARALYPSEAWNATDQRFVDLNMLFLRKWQEIELAARNLVATELGESSARAPLSILINRLQASQVLSPQEVARLTNLTDLRNRIVHQATEVDRSHLETAIKEADEILTKIRSQR